MVTIHYFYDPMCGWCYGATPLIEYIANSDKFKLQLHPGGMLAARKIEASFRQHILDSDKRIAELTGAQFGQAYIDRVASNEALILDSYLTTRAVLVAESLGVNPFNMLKAIQKAHYMDGKSVNERATLDALALELKLDQNLWQEKMQDLAGVENDVISNTQQIMAQLGVQGYPTLILEDQGELKRLPHTEFYGRPQDWETLLKSLV